MLAHRLPVPAPKSGHWLPNEGVVEARRIAATLGALIRIGRRGLGLSQGDLGRMVGLSQSRVSAIGRGLGAGISLDLWVAFGLALRQPLAVSFSRQTRPEAALADAGHLEIQEYLLEIGRRNGWRGAFELPTRAYDPAQSIDVHHEDTMHDCLIIQEAWNRIGDLGAAARSSNR